jgi:GAF domain-containing protein
MYNPSPGPPSRLTPDVSYALDTLVRVVERQSGEFTATILLLSDDGTRVLDAAGPHMPEWYRSAINGLQIGPAAGSCGTAAFRKERVIVSDIQADPLWADYRDLAHRAGVAACWSQPISAADGSVLGTFAMYYPEPRVPGLDDIEIIEAAARRAGMILERAQAGQDREALVAGLV